MNNVSLLGRTTKDIELRYSQSGEMAIANFTLAVNRTFKREGQPEADFIRCICFGKRAEALEKYVVKGQQIAVTGHIQTGSYDNQEGKKIFTTDVIVDQWYFAESKRQESEPNSSTEGFYPVDVDDNDLPF